MFGVCRRRQQYKPWDCQKETVRVERAVLDCFGFQFWGSWEWLLVLEIKFLGRITNFLQEGGGVVCNCSGVHCRASFGKRILGHTLQLCHLYLSKPVLCTQRANQWDFLSVLRGKMVMGWCQWLWTSLTPVSAWSCVMLYLASCILTVTL